MTEMLRSYFGHRKMKGRIVSRDGRAGRSKIYIMKIKIPEVEKMIIYTYSEARQKLSSLLDNAKKEGEILIKRKDGSYFVVRPLNRPKSPLDVKGVDVKLSSDDIISAIREIRERG